MQRVAAFIDGFNLYHSLVNNGCTHLKWLDYRSLASAFILPSKERLVKVIYFSALTPWDREKMNRHRLYIRALESSGVEIVFGKFKEVTRKCRADCCKTYKTFEEKETDVNIAVTMLLEAASDTFDKALLFSGDSDMIAGVRALKRLAPHKHVKVVIPYKRCSVDLEHSCHSSARIKLRHLERNQFPDEIALPGGAILTKPSGW